MFISSLVILVFHLRLRVLHDKRKVASLDSLLQHRLIIVTLCAAKLIMYPSLLFNSDVGLAT